MVDKNGKYVLRKDCLSIIHLDDNSGYIFSSKFGHYGIIDDKGYIRIEPFSVLTNNPVLNQISE